VDQRRGRGGARLTLPVTPDGRYFVQSGILLRCSSPALAAAYRTDRVAARTATGRAVDIAELALGDREEASWTKRLPTIMGARCRAHPTQRTAAFGEIIE